MPDNENVLLDNQIQAKECLYSKNEDIVLRKVGDFFFLVDPRLSYNAEDESLFQTDEIGACFWNSVGTNESLDTILGKLLQFFNDEQTPEFVEQVREDLAEYLQILVSYGFVSEVK